jgi:hypothetical protein
MKNVTVKYGITSIPRNVDENASFAAIVGDENLQAVLGYGDNVKALVNGIEQPMENIAPAGVTITLETKANSKAQA